MSKENPLENMPDSEIEAFLKDRKAKAKALVEENKGKVVEIVKELASAKDDKGKPATMKSEIIEAVTPLLPGLKTATIAYKVATILAEARKEADEGAFDLKRGPMGTPSVSKERVVKWFEDPEKVNSLTMDELSAVQDALSGWVEPEEE